MDSYPQDFPYGILDVAELLHLQRRLVQTAFIQTAHSAETGGVK
mgnify:CR=1 FL=1